MPNDNPEGIGGSLTLEEAANAYANPGTEEEADTGHAETDETIAEDDVETQTQEGEETDEPDDEGQAEEEQTEEPEAPAYVPPEAKVKLPDGTEATVDDLIKGNLRDRDYRQKTMALSEQERSFKAKSEQVQQLEKAVSDDRKYMTELLQAIMPQKPDAAMASVDPVGYVEAKARYESFKEHADYLLASQGQMTERQKAEQEESLKEVRNREWQATLEKMPELKDSAKLNTFVQEVNKFGTETFGFTNAELQNISLDHRQAVVLRDAIAWRKLQASKSRATPAKVEGRPPVQSGGTRQSPQTQAARNAKIAMDRLKSSGSLRDGVAALLASEKG